MIYPQENYMEEKYLSETGRDMTKTYLELAAELELKDRDRFIDLMDGAIFSIRCSRKIKQENKDETIIIS